MKTEKLKNTNVEDFTFDALICSLTNFITYSCFCNFTAPATTLAYNFGPARAPTPVPTSASAHATATAPSFDPAHPPTSVTAPASDFASASFPAPIPVSAPFPA